jgi:outer membrane protein assembly factor BamB
VFVPRLIKNPRQTNPASRLVSIPLALAVQAVAVLPFHSAAAATNDWPQFLGPTRDGIYHGPALAAQWPKEGPPVVWRKEVGEGFSGPVVSQGRLILFHRLGDKEIVECLASETGNAIWSCSYATSYRDRFGFDEGPRGTPAIDADRVFTFGAEGALHCVELKTGRKLWNVDTKKEFAADQGFFGLACSPLVEGENVVVHLGGKDGAGIAAFDKATGRLRWKALTHEAGYSSPVAATLNGRRHLFSFTRSGLAALNPTNGHVFFDFPWRARIDASVNAAVPLIVGDHIFLSTSYNAGAILLRFKEPPEKVWSSDEVLSAHYATPIYHSGFLYGVDGRADPGFFPPPTLRCVEFKTGKVRWTREGLGAGCLILAGNQLLFLTDRGELILAPASPEAFKETGRTQMLSLEVRAHPALADGLLYARSKNQLVCVNLRNQAKP